MSQSVAFPVQPSAVSDDEPLDESDEYGQVAVSCFHGNVSGCPYCAKASWSK